MKTYLHSSGPNGCRKNCRCCKEELLARNLEQAYRDAPKNYKTMTRKEEKAIQQALDNLYGNNWQSCDTGQTGAECQGIKCFMGEHRAAVLLERVLAGDYV